MKGKKILSLILSLVLAVSMIGAMPAKAADSYTNTRFIGIADENATKLTGDSWHFYLTAENYSGNNWDYKYEGFTYDINGTEGKAAEVSSTGGTGIWFKIPASDVSIEEGTILTIKAGNYEPGANSTISDGLYLTEDFHLVYSGNKWLANLNIVDVADGTARQYDNGAFYFNLKDDNGNIIGTGSPNWDYFLWPCDWNNALVGNNYSSYYSSAYIDDVAVNNFDGFLKYTPVLDNAFYMNLANYTIEKGTTVTVKGGFATRDQNNKWACVDYYFFREFSFKYDGSNWSFVKPTTYTDVTLTGTLEAHSKCDDAATQWNLYLTNAGGVESIGWAYTYQGLNYQIGGTSYTMEKMQGTEEGLKHTLYCYIPTSVLPADAPNGTEIVIKAGNYDWADANANQGLAIQNDLTLIVQDGILIKKPVAGTPTFKEGNGSKGFYFTTADETTFPYDVSWNYKTYAVDEADSGVFLNEGKIAAFLQKYDTSAWYVNIETATTELKTGDIVELKGNFIYEATDGSKHRIEFKDTSFVFNGTTFEEYSVAKYSGKLTVAGAQDTTSTDTAIYLKGTDEYSYETTNENGEDWSDAYKFTANGDNGSVKVDGTTVSASFKKYNSSNNYYYLEGLSSVNKGSVVTVSGEFINTDKTVIITFEESKFTWNGSKWIDGEVKNYTGTPVLAPDINYGNKSEFYFSAGDEIYQKDWTQTYTALDGDDNGVFLRDAETSEVTKLDIKLKKPNTWYVGLGSYELTYGDVIIIKGTFQMDGTNDTITFTEATFEFNGTHFSEGEFTATDFTITGLNYKHLSYNDESGCWNMYFNLSNEIPGDVDNTKYPYLIYTIDDVEYQENWFKSSASSKVGEDDVHNLYIPLKGLPKELDKEYVITIKACASQGRVTSDETARTDGIRLTEDYIFAVGTEYAASAPTIDYISSTTGGDANGIYLTSGDDFPALGWDDTLTSVDGSGITVDGSDTGRVMKKWADGKYFISLTDGNGAAAEKGTIIMLKGAFTYKTLYTVTFKTAKYIYTGEKWEVFKATVDSELTSGVVGDADGKNDTANSVDLVRIKKFLAQEANEIYVDVDLNSSGDIDKYDTRLLRWLLVNGIDYTEGSNLTGIPTYTNTEDYMRLAAYVTPKDADGMTKYKNAGFTTLMSEKLAQYESEDFAEYMQLAKAAGLDVLVESESIRTMGEGAITVDADKIREINTNLMSYENFRGYFLGDEPSISEFGTYKSVVDTLTQLAPDKELFMAGLPTYNTNEDDFSTDTSLSFEEKYVSYADAWGNLLDGFSYDFYPFKYGVVSTEWFGLVKNYGYLMRSDWFENLEMVASAAKGSYETGITVQSHEDKEKNSKDYYRVTDKEDISFQVYSALAYGIKSVNYFTYGMHWDDSTGMTQCMDNNETIYNAVKEVNAEIAAIDHVLLNYNWQGTIGFSGENEDGIMDSVVSASYTSPRIKESSATNDTIIGCLKDVNAYDGFMLVNATDPIDEKKSTVSVTFNNATNAKVYVAGKELEDNSAYITVNGNDTITFNATLNEGQGIFVIPYMD